MFESHDESTENGARMLGWASLAIGLTEIVAPRKVEELLGLESRPGYHGILRVLGVREVMHGVGILADPQPNGETTIGVWARVVGDVLDSALLGMAAMRSAAARQLCGGGRRGGGHRGRRPVLRPADAS